MKKYLLVLLVTFFPFTADAAVGFGNVSTVSTASSLTSIAVSGSDVVGVVFVVGDSAADNISAVTWNGVSMTKIGAVQTPGDRYLSAWCINNPASATGIVFTGGSFWRSYHAYYTGAVCPPVDAFATNTVSADSVISASPTVVNAGSWLIMFQKDSSGGKTYSASNNISTMRVNADAGGIAIADSQDNGGAVGSGSRTATLSAIGNTNHGAIAFSIAPTATTPASVGTFYWGDS
jgi:hypothetical protein